MAQPKEKEKELGFEVDMDTVAEDMRSHGDEASQDEYWRKNFSRNIGQVKSIQLKMEDKMDALQATLNAKMSDMQAAQMDAKAQMAQVLALLQKLQANE